MICIALFISLHNVIFYHSQEVTKYYLHTYRPGAKSAKHVKDVAETVRKQFCKISFQTDTTIKRLSISPISRAYHREHLTSLPLPATWCDVKFPTDSYQTRDITSENDFVNPMLGHKSDHNKMFSLMCMHTLYSVAAG